MGVPLSDSREVGVPVEGLVFSGLQGNKGMTDSREFLWCAWCGRRQGMCARKSRALVACGHSWRRYSCILAKLHWKEAEGAPLMCSGSAYMPNFELRYFGVEKPYLSLFARVDISCCTDDSITRDER